MRIACAMVLVLQLAVLVGLALRGMTDRLPYTAIRIAGYAALASFMLMRHSRGAHLLHTAAMTATGSHAADRCADVHTPQRRAVATGHAGFCPDPPSPPS